ncbi:MAG: class I SAM-dependent RNA methyltransferase [Acetobacteraceae bacterium]
MPLTRGRRPRSAAPPAPLPEFDITIVRVGADGDGVAAVDPPVYVPFTLPGERVHARAVTRHGKGYLATADSWNVESPERVDAPCVHFGACGGCVLQHWRSASYLAWKAGLLKSALARAGYPSPDLAPIVASAPGTRRRIDLAARRTSGGIILGLHRHRSADVIDMAACTVLEPRLLDLLAPLRRVLGSLHAIRRSASAILNLLDNGVDLLLRTDAEPSTADRSTLAAFAQEHGLPRISWARGDGLHETLCLLRRPVITLSGQAVTPPPGGFLQASATGEAAIIAAVRAGMPTRLPARARIAELYAGCGTLTFALSDLARVTAWEGDGDAAAAARDAAHAGGLAGRVDVIRRDLARQPLQPSDLGGFPAVLLDPPYGGAGPQMAPIAAARPPVVIYVSCNPAALARDAAVLRGAGYRLASATPIDQFLWSSRLESVCVFRLDRG